MLNSLEIRNYRNLKHLKIDKLGRVNLIVGKNNTGKSSVLEALILFFSYSLLSFLVCLILITLHIFKNYLFLFDH
jgi:AAA15 family ATPase/GTPase